MNFKRLLITITLFSIAMGFMETAVVVYLRKLYYPGGFKFPLVAIDRHIALTEILREAATLVMLLCIGIIAGKNKLQRFAWFIFSFAVWDIFYYVFLKILLNWPSSWFEWDALFLIPVPWTGPVLAPVLISATMIILALYILLKENSGMTLYISGRGWLLLISASMVWIFSFCKEYVVYAGQLYATESHMNFEQQLMQFVPPDYSWWLFILGQLLALTAFVFLKTKQDSFSKLI